MLSGKHRGPTKCDKKLIRFYLASFTFFQLVPDVIYTQAEFSRDFQTILKNLNWPFQTVEEARIVPPQETLKELQESIKNLLLIKGPLEAEETTSILCSFDVHCLPIQLLVQPFEIKFSYHFSGVKSTNSNRNPEWYFTLLLKWMSIHQHFIDKYIQEIFRANNQTFVVKFEFIKLLVRLAASKLLTDLPILRYDEDVFSATIQETLNFDRELRFGGLGYPAAMPSVLAVLTKADIFNIWIDLERKCEYLTFANVRGYAWFGVSQQ